jgi:hypothetical protein
MTWGTPLPVASAIPLPRGAIRSYRSRYHLNTSLYHPEHPATSAMDSATGKIGSAFFIECSLFPPACNTPGVSLNTLPALLSDINESLSRVHHVFIA